MLDLEVNKRLATYAKSHLYLFASTYLDDWDDDDKEYTYYFGDLTYTDEERFSLQEKSEPIFVYKGEELKILTYYHDCDLGSWSELAETYSRENIQKMAKELIENDKRKLEKLKKNK